MGIKIVTDSSTEFTQDEAKALGIAVVPLKSIFGDTEYRDGVDLTPEQFYQMMAEADELPSTSQPNPHAFEKVYREAQDDGDRILAIVVADAFSGTWQSAQIAKETVGGDITIIDSATATLGLQILIRRAIELRDAGASVEEIVEAVEAEKSSIRLYAAIDTLENLLKGGRMTKTTAIAGSLMNFKPIISLINDEIEMAGKHRGSTKTFEGVKKLVEKDGGIDLDRPFVIGYTADRGVLDKFETVVGSLYEGHDPYVMPIGSVIGTHAGPGAAAIAFFAKE